jgi:hypothetical protein
MAGADVAAELTKLAGDMPLSTLRAVPAGAVTETGDDTTGAITLGWTLNGTTPWSYDSAVRLTWRGQDGWKVIWEPAILHRELAGGGKLTQWPLRRPRWPAADSSSRGWCSTRRRPRRPPTEPRCPGRWPARCGPVMWTPEDAFLGRPPASAALSRLVVLLRRSSPQPLCSGRRAAEARSSGPAGGTWPWKVSQCEFRRASRKWRTP